MRSILLTLTILFTSQLFSQKEVGKFTKGDFYFYWGYNRGFFSKSDISFKGNGFDFKLYDVHAADRQSPLAVDPYLHIDQLTIPQYDYRLGYYINNKYNISLGFDHMKYVVNQDQTVKINGYISNTGTGYDRQYNNEDIVLTGDFLQFEHTDGLNYINAEFTRNDLLYKLHKNIELNSYYGLGTGIVFPRTRSSLINKGVNDEWHLSGYGISAKTGLNLMLGKHFYLLGESKLGALFLPSVLITSNYSEKGKQHFSFLEFTFALGYRFSFKK